MLQWSNRFALPSFVEHFFIGNYLTGGCRIDTVIGIEFFWGEDTTTHDKASEPRAPPSRTQAYYHIIRVVILSCTPFVPLVTTELLDN